MKKRTLSYLLLAGLTLGAGLGAYHAQAESPKPPTRGAATVYKGIRDDQIEQITSPARIKAVVAKAGSPSAIWQALEHGEKVECLDCIPAVEKLLYDGNAKNREIAAWWLRRRIFGVFGKDEVYSRTVDALKTNPDAATRARAAEAIGEFLDGAGVPHVASSLVTDAEPVVRAAAARALDRLNNPGPNGELAKALGDGDENVRLSALGAAMHVHGFTDVASVARLAYDPSPVVRRHAAGALGHMRARDSVTALIGLTSSEQESDARTRASAAHALGLIGDASARDALMAAMSDPDSFVRDAARIALRRL
ncbi:MAG TPA: HEAT repeat domain-containing protein [Polyangiaceae bacterium]|jgi:HEAT repeat protein|nr:HEAT repeat domain-containing protein [Polyangiaceae bacterium]